MLVIYLAVLYVIHKLSEYYKLVNSIRNSQRFGRFLSHTGKFAEMLNGVVGIFPDRILVFYDNYNKFKEAGQDVYAVTSVWPQTVLTHNIADADIVRDIVSSRHLFLKPAHHYDIISFLGRNVISSEGDEWKRYRRVCAPAFTTRNNKMVWEATETVMMDIFNSIWKDKNEIILENALDITPAISLHAICAVGFGRHEYWHREEYNEVPTGHHMTFKDAILTVSNNIFFRAALPTWVLNLGPTKRIRDVRDSIKELKQYMSEMIEERKKIGKGDEKHDLLSNLVSATFREGGSNPNEMSEDELIGNTFIFLVAGHETTMHSTAYTFAMLALYPKVQETMYQELKSVCDGRTPIYDDIPKLKYTLAVYYETMRLIPPIPAIPKIAIENSKFEVTNMYGKAQEMNVPKDSSIIISLPGLHYNPKYWEEPEKFMPERFLTEWPRNAFLAFSAGARNCLGQKFAETEVLAVLSFMCLNYQISLRDDSRYPEETFEAKKARVFKGYVGMTVRPHGVPLVFRKRD